VRIGPINLSQPFCQAGLAGYSDRAMRVVARRRGCPYAVTEALLDQIVRPEQMVLAGYGHHTLPLPFGNSGVHIAPLLAGLGGLTSLVWIDKWRPWAHPVTAGLAIFVAVLLESVAFANVYSGWEIAAGSFGIDQAFINIFKRQFFLKLITTAFLESFLIIQLSETLPILFIAHN